MKEVRLVIALIIVLLAATSCGAWAQMISYWFSDASDPAGKPINSINVEPGAEFDISVWYKTLDIWSHNAIELLVGYDRATTSGVSASPLDGQITQLSGVNGIAFPIVLANNVGGGSSAVDGSRPYGMHLALGTALGTSIIATTPVRIATVSLKNQSIPRGGYYDMSIWNSGSGSAWTTFTSMFDVLRRDSAYATLRVNSGSSASSAIAALKSANDNTPVNIYGMVVSAEFRDSYGPVSFAIEDPGRMCGIRVISNTAVNPGDIVDITNANLTTIGGERLIDAVSGQVNVYSGGGTAPKPFAVSGRSSGGGAFGMQGALVSTAPDIMSSGLNSVGLLVRIWGKVTYVRNTGNYGSYFYVDDGSGLNDGSGIAGIKCRPSGSGAIPDALPVKDSYVVVTGVMGVHRGFGVNARYIWTTSVVKVLP